MLTKTETERTGRVLSDYADHAACYDQDTAAHGWCRRRLADALPPPPSDTVLDVRPDTGLCSPLLPEKFGLVAPS
jgi:hypothetical protein